MEPTLYKSHCFQKISTIPNCFKYRKDACLRDIVFKNISVVPNRLKTVGKHALETVFIFSLPFQIV